MINKKYDLKNGNDMTPVDVGCGRLIPQGNLNPNLPGSYGAMMKDLDNAYKSSDTFKSSTSYGFTPGFTIDGKNHSWGEATFQK